MTEPVGSAWAGYAAGTPASYGRACSNCFRAKCKCVYRPEGDSCFRCFRLGKTCKPSTPVRRSNNKRAATRSRTAKLEEKLDQLVTALGQHNGFAPSAGTSQATAIDAASSSGGGNTSNSQISGSPDAGRPSAADETLITPGYSRNDPTSNSGLGRSRSPSVVNDGLGHCTTIRQPPREPTTDVHGAPRMSLPDRGESTMNAQVLPENLDEFFDTIAPQEQRMVLDFFRQECLPFFPFVHLPEDRVTFETMRCELPLLWLCILSLTCLSLERKNALALAIRQQLTKKILFGQERSMDVLMGCIGFLGWIHHHRRDESRLTVWANLMTSVACDMRLNRHLPAQKPGQDTSKQIVNGPNAYRRVLLSVFLVTSVRRVRSMSGPSNSDDAMRWTPHMEDCMRVLAERPEYPGDRVLVAQVRCQLLVERASELSEQAAELAKTSSSAVIMFYGLVKTMREDLDRIKQEFAAEAAIQPIVSMYILSATRHINLSPPGILTPYRSTNADNSTHQQNTSTPTGAATATAAGATAAMGMTPTSLFSRTAPMPADFLRIDCLNRALVASRDWYSAFFAMPRTRYVTLPGAAFYHMREVVESSFRLAALQDGSGVHEGQNNDYTGAGVMPSSASASSLFPQSGQPQVYWDRETALEVVNPFAALDKVAVDVEGLPEVLGDLYMRLVQGGEGGVGIGGAAGIDGGLGATGLGAEAFLGDWADTIKRTSKNIRSSRRAWEAKFARYCGEGNAQGAGAPFMDKGGRQADGPTRDAGKEKQKGGAWKEEGSDWIGQSDPAAESEGVLFGGGDGVPAADGGGGVAGAGVGPGGASRMTTATATPPLFGGAADAGPAEDMDFWQSMLNFSFDERWMADMFGEGIS